MKITSRITNDSLCFSHRMRSCTLFDGFPFLKRVFKKIVQISSSMKKIFLSTSNGFCYLDLEQVLYFKTENPKTKVVLKNGQSAFLNKSLLKCIELVAPTPLPFFRISRFYLVNLNYLFEYINRETK